LRQWTANPADDSLGSSLPFLAQWKWRYHILVRDIGGDCVPNDRLYAVARCMRGLRLGVILIILFALAGGVSRRHLYKALEPTARPAAEIRRALESSNLQVTGTFAESFGNITGFEISIPRCAHPLAVLPIPAQYSAVIPTEYRYRPGTYSIAYVYMGNIYPEERISYRLSLLNMIYRFESLFGLVDRKRFVFYLKVWIPKECGGISNFEASSLERGFASIGQ
jgi:hypothetical protein